MNNLEEYIKYLNLGKNTYIYKDNLKIYKEKYDILKKLNDDGLKNKILLRTKIMDWVKIIKFLKIDEENLFWIAKLFFTLPLFNNWQKKHVNNEKIIYIYRNKYILKHPPYILYICELLIFHRTTKCINIEFKSNQSKTHYYLNKTGIKKIEIQNFIKDKNKFNFKEKKLKIKNKFNKFILRNTMIVNKKSIKTKYNYFKHNYICKFDVKNDKNSNLKKVYKNKNIYLRKNNSELWKNKIKINLNTSNKPDVFEKFDKNYILKNNKNDFYQKSFQRNKSDYLNILTKSSMNFRNRNNKEKELNKIRKIRNSDSKKISMYNYFRATNQVFIGDYNPEIKFPSKESSLLF